MKIGKKIGDDLYVHLSCLDEPEFQLQRNRIINALQGIISTSEVVPNVFKFNQKTDRLSRRRAIVVAVSSCPRR